MKALKYTELANWNMVDGQPIKLEQAMTYIEGQALGIEGRPTCNYCKKVGQLKAVAKNQKSKHVVRLMFMLI